jgi:hypothetical protein
MGSSQTDNASALLRLVLLPRDLRKTGAVSVCELAKRSGYFEFREQISAASLRQALSQQAGCVDDWIAYCEDKRTTSGWYIVRRSGADTVVGYYAAETGRTNETYYADAISACAEFIPHELEEIRAGADFPAPGSRGSDDPKTE